MFFFWSKVLFFLLKPLNLVLLLLVLWWWLRRRGSRHTRKTGWALALVLVIFTNPLLMQAIMLWWQPPVKVQQHAQPYRTAILLTGITMGNQRNDRFFGGGPTDRFVQATRLYHTGVVQTILINGGNGTLGSTREPEAHFLKNELMAQGIPAAHILVESQSRNTWESARNARPILDSLDATQNCLLVTSAMHMKRALAVYRKMGIEAKPHVAHYEALEWQVSPAAFLPDLALLSSWQHPLKEIVGYAAYKLSGKL